jgi:secreted trypsin-like serine protease
LYSSRIVFTAGHLKDNNEFSQLYVSPPNQKLRAGLQAVRVIKKYFPSTYRTKVFKDDFAILILEKPLAQVKTAPLISAEQLAEAIVAKLPMKTIGFGAYQDMCVKMKSKPPCQSSNGNSSLVPRSIAMTPWSADEVKDKYNSYQADLADHLFLTAPYKGGPCGGDSGGPTTVSMKGVNYYVATVATGFWNAYACGQSGGNVGDTLGYTAPVYKFLDLIAKAEKYVAEHPYSPPKSTSKKS